MAGLGVLADRVAGALWGMFIADALAMPTHWFYGGNAQVRQHFGGDVSTYMKAPHPFPESIMSLSNTGGAGRGSDDGDIIGTVINHGKKKYWQRGAGYHYHCTLDAGENTLEVEIARLLMKSMTSGGLDVRRVRGEYVDFMTTPGSHNDAYAASYHRMFFRNRARGVPLEECPDNDDHNVDAIDGLILPAVAILGTLNESEAEAMQAAKASVGVARRSKRVEDYVPEFARILRGVLGGGSAGRLAEEAAVRMFGRAPDPREPDPVVACYIDPNYSSLLHFLAKYSDFRAGVLANANAGGANVDRGVLLGAIWGAQAGASNVPEDLKSGLKHAARLREEIDAFVSARVHSWSRSVGDSSQSSDL